MENLNYSPRSQLDDPGTHKTRNGNNHIERNLSSVILITDRIYHPIAHNFEVSLLLRNEINAGIQFSSGFFINLLQITGNLIANAIKFSLPNELVEVVFRMNVDEYQSSLNMTVTHTGRFVTPDLVSAFNQRKQIAKLIGTNVEVSIGTRLEYVMQLVSEEDGYIYLTSGKNSGATFSLSLPLPKNYKNRRNGFYSNVKNGAVLHNGS